MKAWNAATCCGTVLLILSICHVRSVVGTFSVAPTNDCSADEWLTGLDIPCEPCPAYSRSSSLANEHVTECICNGGDDIQKEATATITCSGLCECPDDTSSVYGVLKSGVVQSSGVYAGELDCKWKIESNSNIHLQVRVLDTLYGWDYLTIRTAHANGWWNAGEQLLKISGNAGEAIEPGSNSPITYDMTHVYENTASAPVIEVLFQSTAGVKYGTGVAITWWTTGPMYRCDPVHLPVPSIPPSTCPVDTFQYAVRTSLHDRALALVPGRAWFSGMTERDSNIPGMSIANSELPTFNANAGPTGNAALEFDFDSTTTLLSRRQHIPGQSHNIDLRIDKGFTIVSVYYVSWTGYKMSLIDLGMDQDFRLEVHGYDYDIQITIHVDGVSCSFACCQRPIGVIDAFGAGLWRTLQVTYSLDSNVATAYVSDMSVRTHQCSDNFRGLLAAKGTITLSRTYVGAPHDFSESWTYIPEGRFFRGSIAGLYFVDAVLSDNEIAAVADSMYRADDNLAECQLCPANAASVAGSSVITDCVCNIGYEGENGEPCTPDACFESVDTRPEDCTSCPADSYSPAGSTTESACLCNAGFEPASGDCDACAAGKYKSEEGNGVCDTCHSDSTTASTGSTAVADCVCQISTQAAGATCITCQSGNYCPGWGVVTACPTGSNSGDSSWRLDQCVCNAGFYGPPGGDCLSCADGKYKSGSGGDANSCLDLPLQSITTDHIDFVCNAGHHAPLVSTGTEMSCDTCDAGTFKGGSGNNENDCTGCKENSESEPGSINQLNCVCHYGYGTYDETGTCQKCSKGMYKLLPGNAACDACPTGSTTENLGSYNVDACIADEGYTKKGAEFVECEVGEFKAGEGDTPCDVCPLHRTTAGTGETSGTACVCTGPMFESAAGVCVCAPGYFYDAALSTCEPCPAGSFCPGTQAGQNIETTVPEPCPVNSHSPAGSASAGACSCVPGNSREATAVNERAIALVPGFMQLASLAGRHNGLVTATTGVGGWRLVRFVPPSNSRWPDRNDRLAGTAPYGTAYDYTVEWSVIFGEFDEFCFSTMDLEYWIYCTRDAANGEYYRNDKRPVIRSSDKNYAHLSKQWNNRDGQTIDPVVRLDDVTDVLYGEDNFDYNKLILDHGGMCVWVRSSGSMPTSVATGGPEGKGAFVFDTTLNQHFDGGPRTFNIGTNGFTAVAVVKFVNIVKWARIFHFYSPSHEIKCFRRAGRNEISVEYKENDAEVCRFTMDGAIPDNDWMTIVITFDHNSNLVRIASGSISDQGTCVFMDSNYMSTFVGGDKNYFDGSMAGLYAVDALLTEDEINAVAARIQAGEDPLQRCAACAAGTWKGETGPGTCTDCISNSDSPAGSTSAPDCACLADHYEVVSSSDPLRQCEACPANSESPAGSALVTDCKCKPGFGRDGGACLVCGAGTFSRVTETDFHECADCDGNALSDIGSDAVEDCQCNAGYTGADGGDCNACEAGGYKSVQGSAACATCPTDTTSVAGAASANDCTCLPGFSGADGGPCSACLAGEYKSVSGSAACESCPTDTTSVAGAASATDCTCLPGFSGADGGPCTACATGTYRAGNFATNWARACGDDRQSACGTDQINTGAKGYSSNAVDGSFEDSFKYCTFARGEVDVDAWWKLHLPTTIRVTGLRVLGRNQHEKRTQGFSIYLSNQETYGDISDANSGVCVSNQTHLPVGKALDITCDTPVVGDYLFFATFNDFHLTLCEVEVWSSQCSLCPLHSSSAPGSTALRDCQCEPGYSGRNGEVCSQCPAGTYSLSYQESFDGFVKDCTDRFDWTGNHFAAYVEKTTHISCDDYCSGQGSVCVAAADNMGGDCDATTGGNSRTQAYCSVKKGNQICACEQKRDCGSCPPNSTSPAGSFAVAACTCNPGYSGPDGGECTACETGKFKTDSGSAACGLIECPADEFSSGAEVNTAAVCWPCPSGAVSAAGSTAPAQCQCQAGAYEETHVLNPPYAQRSYSSVVSAMEYSLLDDLLNHQAWGALRDDANPWMEIDTLDPMYIVGILTQGRGPVNEHQYVERFIVEYRLGDDGEAGIALSDTFEMGSDKQEHTFDTPIYARYIRIIPLTWNYWCCLRAALVVKSCSSCLAPTVSGQGSVNDTACECPAGAYKFSSVKDNRAIALVPGRAQLSTLANRNRHYYAATAPFNINVGPEGKGSVTFDRLYNEYLDGGSHQFNIETNGFTAVVVARFESYTLARSERIFDFGSGDNSNNIALTRNEISQGLYWSIRNGDDNCFVITPDTWILEQDEWLTIVAKYNFTNYRLELTVGGSVFYSTCSSAPPNISVTNTYIGKSAGDDSYFSGSVTGLYAVDAVLTEDEITAVAARMRAGEDTLEACAGCPADTFKTGAGNGVSLCTACPPGSGVVGASTHVNDCRCLAGYKGVTAEGGGDEQCVACVSGKYKASDSTSCEECPTHSDSAEASTAITDCKCNSGYTGPDGGTCSACLADTYKDTPGASACEGCPDFAESVAGATQQIDCFCKVGYKGLPGGDCGFVCPPGSQHGPQNLLCYECDNSKYKPEAGDHECTSCPSHSHHALTNQTSIDACVCQIGYLWNADTQLCDICPPGTFNNRAGDTRCFPCISSSASLAATPVVFPVFPPARLLQTASARRLLRAQQETCVARESDGLSCPGLCEAPAGYQATASGANLEECPANSFQNGSGTVCNACPAPSTFTARGGLVSLAECECAAGYTRSDGVCSACSVGTFKTDSGDAACTPCDPDTTTLETGSTSLAQCVCAAGFQLVGGVCQACPAPSAKHHPGNEACIDCGTGGALDGSKQHLQTSCECEAGYDGDWQGCLPCEDGHYKSGVGDGPCEACAEHALTGATASKTITDCYCHPSDLWESAANGGPDTTAGSCVSTCNAGSTRGETACELCPAGAYKPLQGAQACSVCPEPTSASPAGSVRATDCTCPAGFLDDYGTKYVYVTSIGALSESNLDSELICEGNDDGVSCVVNFDTGYRLHSLILTQVAGQTLRDVTVQVRRLGTLLTLYSCTVECVSGATIVLEGLPGDLLVTATNAGSVRLIRHTRRTASFTDRHDMTQHQAERAVLLDTLGVNDALWLGDVLSSEVGGTDVSCIACLPGIVCL